MVNLGQLARNFFALLSRQRRNRSKFNLRNRSKLVEESFITIIDFLIGAKFITLYFIWRGGVWGTIFTKNLKLKKIFSLILFKIFMSIFFHIIDLKKQSEHSGLRPDMSSLVSRICLLTGSILNIMLNISY